MKIYDKVKVITDDDEYKKQGIHKDMVGRICSAEIRDNTFNVCFIDPKFYDKDIKWTDETIESFEDDKFCPIKIKDLEIIEKGWSTDRDILEELPKNNPRWWCKVEDGYIINLLGEKKNKIPYDYDS